MDTCGFPKAAYYMHQAAWIDERPILHLLPHWNWQGKEGKPIRVMVLTNVAQVELFLNGKSLGEKTIDRLEGGQWEVPYAPGKLEAVGKNGGKECARFTVETTGEPVALKLTPDRQRLAGDGADALPVTVSAVDTQGREVPTANLPVTFELSGPGAIIGHGNGDNCSHEPEQGNQRSLFNGLAQVILQSQRDSSGKLVLKAGAPGLKSAETQLDLAPIASIPAVPATNPVFSLGKWLASPVSKIKPDPNQKIGETDMNTWTSVQAGSEQKFDGGNWAAYRVTFTPPEEIQKNGGQILFKKITGTAEVWLDGQLQAAKKKAAPGDLKLGLSPSVKARTLTVLINADEAKGKKAGLAGQVVITPAKH